MTTQQYAAPRRHFAVSTRGPLGISGRHLITAAVQCRRRGRSILLAENIGRCRPGSQLSHAVQVARALVRPTAERDVVVASCAKGVPDGGQVRLQFGRPRRVNNPINELPDKLRTEVLPVIGVAAGGGVRRSSRTVRVLASLGGCTFPRSGC